MAHGSKKVIYLALAANAGIACAKFVAFVITASASILAEAIHSLADTSNQVLLLWGMKRAAQPPDDLHPFGYKKESYFWSFIVAVMLFSMGGLFALYEGLHKFAELRDLDAAGEPHEMSHPEVAIGVLVFSILLEGFAWRGATKEINRLRGEESMMSFLRRSKSTEIIVIWLEDTGALVGLLLALTGIGLVLLTGNPYWDAYATFAIGALLVVIAFLVARETKSLLIGEAASREAQEAIRALVTSSDGVVRLMNMRTMQLGDDEFLVALKLEWDSALSLDEVVARTNELERSIRRTIPRARYVFVEADAYDPDKVRAAGSGGVSAG